MTLPSQPPRPTSVLDKNGGDAAAGVDSQQRIDALQRELFDTRQKLLDARAKSIDWWLALIKAVTAILALIVAILTIQRWPPIESKAQQDVEVFQTEDGKNLVQEMKKGPRPVASLINLTREEAIKKWHSIATVVGGKDDQLEAHVWLSIGYLHSEGDNWEAAISAYTKAIDLDQNTAPAYNNRGNAKEALGNINEARKDYQKALALAQEADNASLAAVVRRNMSRLANNTGL